MSAPGSAPTSVAEARVRGFGRALLLVATWTLGGVFVIFAVLGSAVAGRVGGWAWTVLYVAPLVGLTWWITRRSPTRRVLRGVGVGLGVVLWAALVAVAVPGHDRLAQVSATLPVPWELPLLRTDAAGSALCFGECPSVTHHYAVPDAEEAAAAMGYSLAALGWTDDGGAWRRGKFQVQLRAEEVLPMAERRPPLVQVPDGWGVLVVVVGSGG